MGAGNHAISNLGDIPQPNLYHEKEKIMAEAKEIVVVRQPDTKNKKKWLGGVLGISVSVYMDKLLEDAPDELILRLELE
jgi:hypothetical protein